MFACLLLGLTLLFAPVGLAQNTADQTEPSASDQPGFKIGVAVDQVFLSVNARAPQGGFVRDLRQEDFQVFEDEVRQQIVNFYSEAVPVHVVLLIDVSGSTRDAQGAIRRAALQFAQTLDPEDRVAIITFNDKPRLILNWTNDIQRVETALESIYAKGRTVLNDALYVTFDDLLKDLEGKKAVILLTDGVDTGSMVGYEEAFDLAVRSEAMVYVVSKLDEYWAAAIAQRAAFLARIGSIPKMFTDEFIIEAKRYLNRLARQTGGKVLGARAFAKLSDIYARVAEELKNQYYISYIPSNIIQDGRWRSIEVRAPYVAAIVNTRPGYYASHSEMPSPSEIVPSAGR